MTGRRFHRRRECRLDRSSVFAPASGGEDGGAIGWLRRYLMPRIAFKYLVLKGLSLALVPFALPSPAPAETAQAAANPTEVTIELRAHDRKGNIVPDLKPSEVEITDAGAAVSLKSLRFAGQPQDPETITFVFDQVVQGVAKTDRELAEQFLTAVSGRNYLLAVFKVEGRLHLVQAPTADVEAVKNAIAAATVANRPDYIKATEAAEKQAEEDARPAQGARQATAKMLMAMLTDSQKIGESDSQSTPSVAALLAASRGQQDVPGRKAILYFSQGLAWHSSSPETLRDVVEAANRAHVSVFSFDAEMGDVQAAQALNVAAMMGNQQAMGNIRTGPAVPGPGGPPPDMLAQGMGVAEQSNEYAGRLETSDNTGTPRSLAAICARTGGMHVFAMTEGRRGASEIATDLNSYYLASWLSPASGDDNRLRPIVVKPLRKGVLVASVSGYFPVRGSNVAKVSAVEGRLLEALAAPALRAELPLMAAVLRYANTADEDVNSVVVQVPLDRVELKGDQGSVSVLAQLKDPSGAVVRKFSADIPRRPAVGDQEPAPGDVVSFRRQFSAPPGEYVLESAAFDANGGKIGAQRTNVTLPAAANGLALGDVLLVGRIDPAGPADDSDPLRCALGIVVPNLFGHISKAEGVKILLFFHLHADASSSEKPTLAAELRRDGDLIGSLPMSLTGDPNRKTIPYLTTLGADSLPAGRYEMTVILRQGGHRTAQTVDFTLE